MPNNTDANSQYNRDNIGRLLPVTRQNGMDSEQHDSSLSRVSHRVTRVAETASRAANRLHHCLFRPASAAQATLDRNSSNSTHSINHATENPPNTVRTAIQRPISELRRVTRQHPLPINEDENDATPPQRRNNP